MRFTSAALVNAIMDVRERIVEICPELINMAILASRGDVTLTASQSFWMKDLLDRGLGRAPQTLEIKHETPANVNNPGMLTHDQLNLLVQNKAVAFIASLHKSGQLNKIVAQIEGPKQESVERVEEDKGKGKKGKKK